MALHIVSYFFGTKVGERTAHRMEYPYPQHNKRSRNIQQNSVYNMKVKEHENSQKIDWRTYSSPKIAAWDVVGGFSSCI